MKRLISHNTHSSPEANSFPTNDHCGRRRFAKAARGSGRKGAKVFRLFDPDVKSGEFKKNQRLYRYRNVRFAAPKHFYSTFFALEKSGTSNKQHSVCKAEKCTNNLISLYSAEVMASNSSPEVNSFPTNDHRGIRSIPGSEAEKNGVSLCFVKSACVSGPDLPLLTKNTEKVGSFLFVPEAISGQALTQKETKKSRLYIRHGRMKLHSAVSTPTRKRHWRFLFTKEPDGCAQTGVRQRFIPLILQRFVCKAKECGNNLTSLYSAEVMVSNSSPEVNSFPTNDHRGVRSIPGSEAEKNGISLCFVKSACVSGPDLSLLTKNTETAILSERLRMELKAFFVTFCSFGQKVNNPALEKSGITLFFFLFFPFLIFSQNLPFTIITKTTQDEILIKWLPTGYDAMRVFVREGCTVERVVLTSGTAQTADYNTAEKIAVIPAIKRLKNYTSPDSATQRIVTILDPFTADQPPSTKEAQEFAFAMAVLELTVSSELSSAVGCQILVLPEENVRYAFRFTLKGYPPVFAEVNSDELTNYPAIADFTAKIDRKKSIELTWNAREYESYGYAFHVEKSLDSPPVAGTHLTTTPYFPMRTQYEKTDKLDFLRDDRLQEGKTHYYRLVGINYFGEEAYFSEWQKIYVPRHLNAEVYIDTVYADKQTRVIAGTAYRLSTEPVNLKSYVLFRSSQRDGNYAFVQQKESADTNFRFTVDMLQTGDQFYYKVAAVSVDNDTVFSTASYLFTLDQEPPSQPTGLTGTINEKGIVSLSWTASKDQDLQGYRIYRANHKKEDFVEQNTDLATLTTFTDTVLLNNLTPELYYCIKAVDKNFNNSPFSDTILILKPDTIAPVAALLHKPVVQDSLIRLTWINSPSEDVQRSVLVRYVGTTVDTLLHWSDTLSVFTDKKLVPGTAYRYSILTQDKSGNTSEAQARQIYYEPGYRKALDGFSAMALPQQKCVRLTWKAPQGEVFSYQIYKATGTAQPTLYKTFEDASVLQFDDKQVSSGNTYTYSIKYVLKSGVHGLPTKGEKVFY